MPDGGGVPSHSSSISTSSGTTSFACSSSSARRARCFGPPRATGAPPTLASSGPSIRNSIAAWVSHEQAHGTPRIPAAQDAMSVLLAAAWRRPRDSVSDDRRGSRSRRPPDSSRQLRRRAVRARGRRGDPLPRPLLRSGRRRHRVPHLESRRRDDLDCRAANPPLRKRRGVRRVAPRHGARWTGGGRFGSRHCDDTRHQPHADRRAVESARR